MARKEKIIAEKEFVGKWAKITRRHLREWAYMRERYEYAATDEKNCERIQDERQAFWMLCYENYGKKYERDGPVDEKAIDVKDRDIRKNDVGHGVARTLGGIYPGIKIGHDTGHKKRY
jgi:hypothetical protein